MAIKAQEQAVIDLVINGQQANSSLRDLTGAYNALFAQVSRLREADNPEQYRQQIAMLNQVRAARDAERQSVLGQTEANKGFFADFKKGFSEIQEMAERITIGTLIYKGVSASIDFVKDLFNGAQEAYDEAQRTQTQLQQVLKTTGGVAGETKESLEKYQKTLMDQTGVDDDVIAKGEEMLLTFTNIRGKIYDQALPAIVDMTAALNGGKVTMEGVQATAIQVGKALNDPINGATALKKVGVTLDDQQKQQIKTMQESNNMMGAQAIILKELQKEFGGTAKAISDTDVGALQRFETRVGNIKESIGKWITAGRSLIADFLGPFLSIIERLTETRLSATLEDERMKMNMLALQITDTNTAHDERIKLIKKLQEMYPDHLKNLNAEKSTNLEIANAVSLLNDMYINKIILAKKDEEIEDQNQKTAELRMKQLSAESAVREQLVKMHEKFPEFKMGDGTSYQKLSNILRQYQEAMYASHNSTGGIFDPTFDAFKAINQYSTYLQFAKESAKQGDEMLKKREELKRQLGIDDTFNGIGDKKTTVTPPTSGPSKAEQDAAARKAEAEKKTQAEYMANSKALSDRQKEFNASSLADTLAKNDKEVAALENKYNKEWTEETAALTKLRNNKYANQDEIQQQQDKIDALAGQKNKAVADLRAKQEKDLTNQIQAFRDKMNGKLETELQKETDEINAEFDKRKADAGTNADQLAKIEEGRQAALTDAKIRNEKLFQEEKTKIDEEGAVDDVDRDKLELARINKHYDDEIDALEKKFGKEKMATLEGQALIDEINKNRKAKVVQSDADKAKKKLQDQRDFEIDTAKEVSDAVFTIGQRNRQASTDARIKDLESQKDKELSNTNLTEAQKASINDKYAKQEADIKLKAWKADQAAAEEQAIINGALAVLKALAQTGPLGAFIIPGIIAETAVQVATIAAQPTPQFAKGGVFNGPSHAQGGLNVVNTKTGQTVANVEGDEPWMVLSRETRRNNGGLINQLLFNSIYRNGAAVDVAGINNGIKLARGGYVSSIAGAQPAFSNGASTTAPGNGTSSPTPGQTDLEETNRLLAALHDKFDDWSKKPWEFNNRAFEQYQARVKANRDAANG